MGKIKNNMKENYKENKRSSLTVYFILRLLVILCMVRQFFLHNYSNVLLCLLTLILFILPFFIQKKLKITFSNILEIIILLFIFSSEILGEINNFYGNIPQWDTILHTLNGFLAAGIGFSLVDLLNNNVKSIQMNPFFMSLLAFSFSMMIGVGWEFFEYTMDTVFRLDMQKDTIVTKVSTVELDPKKQNHVIKIDNIAYTKIYDNNNQVIAEIPNGYLDLGIHDTMNDLIVNFIGAFIFSLCGYLYLTNNHNFKFTKNFIVIHKN